MKRHVSSAQVKAIERYILDHWPLNAALRNVPGYDLGDRAPDVAEIDRAMTPIDANTKLYRGGQLPTVPTVGDVIEDAGYISTSMSKKVAKHFVERNRPGWVDPSDPTKAPRVSLHPDGPNVFMTLNVPRGTPALGAYYHPTIRDIAFEDEITLGRGLRYRIDRVTRLPNGDYDVQATVLRPNQKARAVRHRPVID